MAKRLKEAPVVKQVKRDGFSRGDIAKYKGELVRVAGIDGEEASIVNMATLKRATVKVEDLSA